MIPAKPLGAYADPVTAAEAGADVDVETCGDRAVVEEFSHAIADDDPSPV